MDLKTYFRATKPEEREPLAKACDTSVEYLRLCANGHRRIGPELARKLVAAEPRLTLAKLRPDLWGEPAAA